MRLWQHIRPRPVRQVPAPRTGDRGGDTIRTFWDEVTGEECCFGQALALAKTTRETR